MAETAWINPTAYTSGGTPWTTPANAYTSNDVYASSPTEYSGYNIPGTMLISCISLSQIGWKYVVITNSVEQVLIFGGSTDSWSVTSPPWVPNNFVGTNFFLQLQTYTVTTTCLVNYLSFVFPSLTGFQITGIAVSVEIRNSGGSGDGIIYLDQVGVKVYYSLPSDVAGGSGMMANLGIF